MRAISGTAWWLALVITAVAVFSKIAGCGLGAKLTGFSNREALQLGIGMVSRGEVGLIVASFALIEGLISQESFSIVVFMVIVATLLTPPMLRAAFAAPKKQTPPGFNSLTGYQEEYPTCTTWFYWFSMTLIIARRF